MKRTVKLTGKELKRMISESVRRVLTETNINETSSRLLGRAADKAFNDMMRNWNDGKIRTKREAQWKKFSRDASDKETKEKESICPSVPESELKNMPKDTYVILDGRGRNFYGEFMYRYSGYAGTKEQCDEFVNRYYDKYADWEFLPKIVTLEDYFQHYT